MNKFFFAVFLCFFIGATSTAGPNTPPPLEKPTKPDFGKGDPYLAQAWHLGNMRVFDAWKTTKGNHQTVIAFVDSGIEYNHPDLSPNLYWNEKEWPMDGHDKDGNGFIDDVIGWDYVNNKPLPYDRSTHGTFLAGLAISVEGNGIGTVGVCPQCATMPLKFINWEGGGETEDAIHGIQYATAKHVAVINVSFSGEGKDNHLEAALRDAGEKDIVVVAAASNDGLNLEGASIYPAKYQFPHMITVAASNSQDQLWYGSNYGRRWVHFAVPGEEVIGPYNGKWDTGSGTSDSAAIASGVVGLVRSANSRLNAKQVVDILMKTVRRVPELENTTISGGIINAADAVKCAVDPNLTCLRDDLLALLSRRAGLF